VSPEGNRDGDWRRIQEEDRVAPDDLDEEQGQTTSMNGTALDSALVTQAPATVTAAEKWRHLTFLAVAELLAMVLWFSASAVLPQLTAEWGLSGAQQSWMTMSVQIGFVVGALLSAGLNIADRISSRHLFALSAVSGAAFNAAIPLFETGPEVTLGLRFLTGVALAGVYPPGMKLVATWTREDRGLAIGLLVGALTLGSAVPHLLNALPILGEGGMPPWRSVLLASSAQAAAAALIAVLLVKEGPFLARTAPPNWRFAARMLTDRPSRLANLGYLGHMWELYAMWTWVPIFLIASYQRAGLDLGLARLAGFAVVGVGAVGSIVAGSVADRVGRTLVTTWSLLISGGCACVAGFLFASPSILTILCLLWGFAVVADSAQFSAAVSELTDPRYVGTALTMQTSLGFLLTLFSIRLIPPLVDMVGWERVFIDLVLGPAVGVWSMLRLRRLPEAVRMASGNR
jgi:MFS family permease